MACNYYSCSLKLLHTCAIAHAQCGMHTENVAQHVNHTYCAQNLIRTNSYLTVTALRARINWRIGSEQCFIGVISPSSALGIWGGIKEQIVVVLYIVEIAENRDAVTVLTPRLLTRLPGTSAVVQIFGTENLSQCIWILSVLQVWCKKVCFDELQYRTDILLFNSGLNPDLVKILSSGVPGICTPSSNFYKSLL